MIAVRFLIRLAKSVKEHQHGKETTIALPTPRGRNLWLQPWNDDDAIEQLVIQICYRVSDLAYLLKAEGSNLSRYCRHLRREPDVEYDGDYFDEQD